MENKIVMYGDWYAYIDKDNNLHEVSETKGDIILFSDVKNIYTLSAKNIYIVLFCDGEHAIIEKETSLSSYCIELYNWFKSIDKVKQFIIYDESLTACITFDNKLIIFNIENPTDNHSYFDDTEDVQHVIYYSNKFYTDNIMDRYIGLICQNNELIVKVWNPEEFTCIQTFQQSNIWIPQLNEGSYI